METMVTMPTCPDHGRLLRDLALGRLDDRDAAHAEQVLASCSACRAWWRDNLEGEPAAAVEREVAQVFATFQAPVRHRVSPWLAAAAALFIVIGGLLVIQTLGPIAPPADVTASSSQQLPLAAASGEVLFADGLESGEVKGWIIEAGQPAAQEAAADTGALFVNGLESGDLSGWSS
jgi:hypothetical protein